MSYAVCITGHRPPGLPGGYDGSDDLSTFICSVVEQFYTQGYRKFVSGGALGADQIFARAVLMNKHPDIELIIARPFPSQASKWPDKSQQEFERICTAADEIVDVSPDPYSPAKMQIRNKWMVDHSGCVIALWNGKESGGTWNCLSYAREQGKTIYHINPFTLAVNII